MKNFMYFLPMVVTLILFNPIITTSKENVPDPSCPSYTENDTAKIVEDPSDCTRFFICDAGRIKRSFNCSCGLLFNPTLQVCDWPTNVNCTQPPRTCVVPTTTTTTSAPTNTTVENSIQPAVASSVTEEKPEAVNLPSFGVEVVRATVPAVIEELPAVIIEEAAPVVPSNKTEAINLPAIGIEVISNATVVEEVPPQ